MKTVLFFFWLLVTIAAFGCSSNGGSDGYADDGGVGVDAAGPHLAGDGSTGRLTITPMNPTLDVTGSGVTLQFQATFEGSSAPESATWGLDKPLLGSLDGNGLFTASGSVGGLTNVVATVGGATAYTLLTVHLSLTDNPGQVDPTTQGLLQGGGTADPTFRWLYPYDQTVFARGIAPPVMQTGGGGFDAAYLHIQFASVDYQGFYGPSTPERLALPTQLWETISLSAAATDVIEVQLTKIQAGHVTGPIKENWHIAPGTLRGTVYYNSYNSHLAGNTGAVMSVRPGGTAKVVVAGCRVCHAVSADGSTLVAANEVPHTTATDRVWDLKNNDATLYDAPNREWAFGALSPDGTRLLRFGAVPDSRAQGAFWSPNVRGLGQHGDLPSAVFDSRTGAPISAPGLDGQGLHMMMPIFSPDGTRVAFNHYDKGHGHSIAVMDVDPRTNTFSNLRDVATIPSAYLGWPTFTPDNQFLLFAAGTNVEYDTVSDNSAVIPQPISDIVVAHVPSKTIAAADQLNGKAGGAYYLPFGEQAEAHLNFEPTIMPLEIGGYYWVVFTTRREYGNTLNDPNPYNLNAQPGSRKKLWVAALDMVTPDPEHPYNQANDITHPAFYLDGQELGAGNMRGFWALDPCQANGASCGTGDECCSGFCRETSGADGGGQPTCVPPSGCAQESEKCMTSADCCGAQTGVTCIAGYCATPSPH